jgi:ABC-type glycerol-3-phosphate transport system permease component
MNTYLKKGILKPRKNQYAYPWWKSQTLQRTVLKVVIYILLFSGSLIFLAPLAWMISTSLKPLDNVWALKMEWIPKPILWTNYPEALKTLPFFLYVRNSVFVAVLATFGSVFSSALVGYGFARFRFPGRNIFFFILLGTMMLPGTVTFIPVYILFAKIHWVYTFLPLIVPPFLGAPFNIFLMRQFLLTIPMELDEAARMDGASSLRIFWSILLPLMRPAVATIAIFAFMSAWNDFFGPLLYLKDTQYTLSLGLAYYRATQISGAASGRTNWHYMMAIATLAMIPNVILFFLAQKQFMEGITLTGLKG